MDGSMNGAVMARRPSPLTPGRYPAEHYDGPLPGRLTTENAVSPPPSPTEHMMNRFCACDESAALQFELCHTIGKLLDEIEARLLGCPAKTDGAQDDRPSPAPDVGAGLLAMAAKRLAILNQMAEGRIAELNQFRDRLTAINAALT